MKPLDTVVTSVSKSLNARSSVEYIKVNSTFGAINVKAIREYTPFDPKIARFLAKYPPDNVSICHRKLFREYMKKVTHNPLERMMWIALDYGHQIMQLVRDEHMAYTYELLLSSDRVKMRMAEEAMQRTLGVYEIRHQKGLTL